MFKNRLVRCILLFLVGGFSYCTIEICARGFSHISMLIAGGLSFIIIGYLNKWRADMSLVGQMVISALIITSIEFSTGIVVNKIMNLNVWDYSRLPYNFMGQICLLYTNIWFLLSALAIFLDDYIRYYLMGDKKPHYKIF
ncbi:MAG: hypothetical protein E7262_10225 [Lachnospiraceae bacterium]|nr:hypothetical protein [Lachnospiraceae bacterium]